MVTVPVAIVPVAVVTVPVAVVPIAPAALMIRPLVVPVVIGASSVVEPAVAIAGAVSRGKLAAVVIAEGLATVMEPGSGRIEVACGRTVPAGERAAGVVLMAGMVQPVAAGMTSRE